MEFSELDEKLRVFETAYDFSVPPGNYLIARIDGKGFTRLTKELIAFEKPFDSRFHEMMVATTEHLLQCGFRIVYGYTQSDEISLLFDLEEDIFGRKTRKYHSILAAETSAKFSLLLGQVAAFDCRLSILPNVEFVYDYFRWRQEDAFRNALSAHCYWLLREQGKGVQAATDFLSGKSKSDKNELLFANGINVNDLPTWQKRGTGLYWQTYQKEGFNPVQQQKILAERRRVAADEELPMGEEYIHFLKRLL